MRISTHNNQVATNQLFDQSIPFRLFGAQHGLIIALTILASVLIPVLANRYLMIRQRLQLAQIWALAMSLSVVGWVVIEVAVGEFDMQKDLPLNICNSAALLAPVLMWKPTLRMHEVLYFAVLAGTLQAVLTPDLPYGFPHYGFFRYWVVHSGLVAYVIYVTWSLKLFPDIRGLFRAFGWLNLYAAVMFVLNLLIGSNYMYLMRKPETPSLLDMFGPWPWYILVCELAALVIFFIVWTPVVLRSRRADTRTGDGCNVSERGT